MSGLEDVFGQVVYSYTRTQALEDGQLVDVTEQAREAGIRYPVAVTRALWDKHIVPPKKLEGWQDIEGRLWDVLVLFRYRARQAHGDRFTFVVLFQEHMNRPPFRRQVKAIVGPGDNAEPVITLMLPEED